MIAVTLLDEPEHVERGARQAYAVSLVLSDDVASDLRTGDPEARRLVTVACEALVDALIATHASVRHDLN